MSGRVYYSDAWKAYAENAATSLRLEHPISKGYPLEGHFTFYMKSEKLFDLTNMAEGPQDLLVKYGIIKDDDYKHFIPVFKGVQVDKDNPRTEIRLHSS